MQFLRGSVLCVCVSVPHPVSNKPLHIHDQQFVIRYQTILAWSNARGTCVILVAVPAKAVNYQSENEEERRLRACDSK